MEHLVTWLRAQWDRVAAVVLLVAGAILVIAGYFSVSGADAIDDQLSYLASGGVAGLFCLGLGASLLISANLGDEWRKLDELVKAVRGQDPQAENVIDVAGSVPPVDLEADARTVEQPGSGDSSTAELRTAGRIRA